MRRAMRRRDSGATLVEAAIAMPLVVLLVLGIIEFGFAWRDVNTIERGLQTATRSASSLSTTRYADYEALRALDSSLAGMAGADIERVIIYRSTTANGTLPASCAAVPVPDGSLSAKGVSGSCNVYSRAQVNTESPVGFPDTGASNCSGGWDANWCPFARIDDLPNPDYLGVWIEVSYRPYTGLIPGPEIMIQREVVFQVEPCVPGSGLDC